MLKHKFFRRLFSDSGKLLLIAILWLGGIAAFGAVTKFNLPRIINPRVVADGPINVWWPTDGAKVNNLQTFKAVVQDKSVSDYDMTWSVDGGQQNAMYDSSTDYPHKEAVVDLISWNWKGTGPYKVTFKAVAKSGEVLGETSVNITIPGPAQGPTTIEAPSATLPPLTGGGNAFSIPVASADSNTSNTSNTNNVVNTSPAAKTMKVLWPTPNASVSGVFTLKATVEGASADSYTMQWQVDGGRLNDMTTNGENKEASIDVTYWKWRQDNNYLLTFIAKDRNGSQLGKQDVRIIVGTAGQTPASERQINQKVLPETPVADTIPTVMPPSSSGNPLAGAKLYIDSNSPAKRQADAWRSSRPQDAFQMDKIANTSSAVWLGGWNGNVKSDVQARISDAKSQGAVPTFIAYNIPGRDCGQYSAGGLSGADAYRTWIRNIADGIGSNKAVVVLEPDALALTTCLSQSQMTERFNLVSDAIGILKSKGNIAVYLDAGHSSWIGADDMANRLKQAGVAKADGFALNVSNFQTTDSSVAYGNTISGKIGGKHFIIDTARNGLGPNGSEWCNPSGRALGQKSTTNTGHSRVDAFIWLKTPGESDGNCNGGPSAGTWWPEYALGLAQRSAF